MVAAPWRRSCQESSKGDTRTQLAGSKPTIRIPLTGGCEIPSPSLPPQIRTSSNSRTNWRWQWTGTELLAHDRTLWLNGHLSMGANGLDSDWDAEARAPTSCSPPRPWLSAHRGSRGAGGRVTNRESVSSPVFSGLPGAIGNTPLFQLTRMSSQLQLEVYAELEEQNPGGSIKERSPFAPNCRSGRRRPRDARRTVIVESSS